MAAKVGTKGQVVVEKEIRDRLGIKPGWMAIQRLVDDHVELYFVPPEHNRSLMGGLKKYIKGGEVPSDEDWHEVKERAWTIAAEEKVGVRERQP